MKKSIVLLLTLMFFLQGCQFFNSTQPSVTFAEVPEVSIDLSQDNMMTFDSRRKQGLTNRYEGITIANKSILRKPENLPQSLFYDSGVNIPYPHEGVKGIYLPISSILDEATLAADIEKLKTTALNAVVLDFKDDSGQIIPTITSDNPYIAPNVVNLYDYRKLMPILEENGIYPIARIVTFKDNYLSAENPEFSFKTKDGELWVSDNANFTNPFLKEVWDYNIAIAIEAAKMGFKDIQFDYVRFSDGFAFDEADLVFSKGEFENYVKEDPNDAGEERVAAITQFLAYAREKLAPYGVNVSADLFGIVTISGRDASARGIGQHFVSIAENVDVVSAMIYPSHWGAGFFGLDSPDAQPYDLVNEYMLSEKQVLEGVSNPVVSRPWIQNFTRFSEYSDAEVQAQINALADNGIYEYLLWNAYGEYIENVDYAPELTRTQ